MSLLFAATSPDRTVALVLYGTMARFRRDVDYPHGIEDSRAAPSDLRRRLGSRRVPEAERSQHVGRPASA